MGGGMGWEEERRGEILPKGKGKKKGKPIQNVYTVYYLGGSDRIANDGFD